MIKVGDKVITFGKFADGTCHTNIDCSQFEKDAPITWLYDEEGEAILLWFLAQHCRDHEGYRRKIIIPYMPEGRQDRTKIATDVFTLKYFAQFLNALHFDYIETFDAHSDVTCALINHIHNQSPVPLINQLLTQLPNDTLIFHPDEGAFKRREADFKMPQIFGIKERNWETQKVEKLVIGGAKHMIAGHNILIVDDICGKGSTIYHASQRLKELGANKIFVYVSHCENTILSQPPHILSNIEKMFTTNSIYGRHGTHEKIEIIYNF